jgi:hypothetical protein
MADEKHGSIGSKSKAPEHKTCGLTNLNNIPSVLIFSQQTSNASGDHPASIQ